MKYFLFILTFTALGIVAGAAASYRDLARIGRPADELVAAHIDERLAKSAAYNPALPHPRAIADELGFNFGQMERGSTKSHAFTIRNNGDMPLQLEKESTSCKCTLSGLDKDTIQPGEIATVTLEWTADTDQSKFRQTATIKTNDPGHPTLKFAVEGEIVQAIRVDPSELVINKIAGEERAYEARVTSANFANLEIVGHSFEDPATAQYFGVEYRTLAPAELGAPYPDAPLPLGGALVTVSLKPGLPLGRVRQTIRLATNLPQKPEVSLPVRASIEGDVSIVGGGAWRRGSMTLDLGVINMGQAMEEDLKVLVRGPHRDQTRLEIKRVVPEGVQAELGETKALADGRVLQTPLVVRLPTNLPAMSYLGNNGRYGELVLGTGHPDAPEVVIRLKFAIQE